MPFKVRHGYSKRGMSDSTYVAWKAMKRRCLNPNQQNYPRYGGKGVTVCERWLVFDNFLEDMGECPPRKTLDRFPNRHGNYEPGNCRWATQEEQVQNKDWTQQVTILGQTKTIKEWAKAAGVSPATFRKRRYDGWSWEACLAGKNKYSRWKKWHSKS